MHDINYKHLHYFWVVANEGSIVNASRKLHITPQTISGQLSLLEERMGHSLFMKSGRSLELTETGRVVHRYANEIFELGKELNNVLRGSPAPGASDFIVSAASALPKTIVYKIIEPVLSLPLDINLTSKEGPISNILADLAVHEVDLVLTDTPLTSAYNVKAYNHLLGESDITFFAAPALANTLKGTFPQCLNDAPILLPTKQNAIRQTYDLWIERLQVFPMLKGQFDDSALMKAFGQAGLGVFFMPRIIEKEICETFKVQIIGRTDEIKQPFYAISAERKVKHPAVAAICNTARDIIFNT
jgi:LysR family transcriptional activator of nhaA